MSDDDLRELTPEQIAAFHRAAATLKDEDFSPEELAGIRKGFLQLTKDKAHEGKIWYEQPNTYPSVGHFGWGAMYWPRWATAICKPAAALPPICFRSSPATIQRSLVPTLYVTWATVT